jgi:hypothetical protein
VDTFFFQGDIIGGIDSGIEQTIHENLSILFPVFVTAGAGVFSLQIEFRAIGAGNGGAAFSDFASSAVVGMSLPPGASIAPESGFLSQAVPEGSPLLLLALGCAALLACFSTGLTSRTTP